MHSDSEKLDEVEWLEEFQVNACLCARQEKSLFNQSVLKREIDTFNYIESTNKQHDAETEMLMCISDQVTGMFITMRMTLHTIV